MNRAQLLQHFNTLAETPDAVAKLRKMIVRLAAAGGLVPQKTLDENVSKTWGKLNLSQPGTKPEKAKLPNWERWRMVELLKIQYGYAFESSHFVQSNEGMPLIRIRDISATETVVRFVGDYPKNYLVETGDYLIGMDGDFNLRRWKGPRALLNQRVCRLHGFSPVLDPAFAALAIQEKLDAIHGDTSFVTVKHLSAKQLNATWLEVPPLAEQRRIVAKVDELLALCDELEARQIAAREHRTRLVRSTLDHLTTAQAEPEFRHHAAFVLQHSDLVLDSVLDLRKAILSLAVLGKLVSQDDNDKAVGNISEIKDVVSKPSNNAAKVPFEIPDTWQWKNLGLVSELINGDRSKNYPNKVEYVQEGVPWINTGHIEPDGTLSIDSMHYITRKKFDSLRSGKVRQGDLVYCLRGATLGKTAIISQFHEGAVASSLVIIRLSPLVNSQYAYCFLTSPLGRQQIWKYDNGSAQPNLSADSVKKYWIPLPPLAEQQRIVAKVDELMRWCDALEARLTAAQTTAANLLDATLHQILTA